MRPQPQPTRPRVDVRLARVGDAEGVVALQNAIYREGRWFVGDGPPGVGALAGRIRAAPPGQSLHLVATALRPSDGGRDGGRVVGWLELHRLQPDRLQHVAVLTLAVAADHRRRGIGRRLLRRALHWAPRVGIRKVSLHVRAGNRAAVALYHDEGFELEGRERDQVRTENGFEDNLLMARFVGPAAGEGSA